MESRAHLLEILTRARSLGHLGPGDPSAHLSHAMGFAEVGVAQLAGPPARFADLGTGGGVPGLALAVAWPGTAAVFIESSARRCESLVEWVDELGIGDRVKVLEGRAEVWAHTAGFREAFDLVTARSFARPAVTAEIAAGLVGSGGVLVVSEPPESPADRWPANALANLGFGPAIPVTSGGVHYASLRKDAPAGAKVPRASGRPAKRPLW